MIRYSNVYDPETFPQVYRIEKECFPSGQRYSQKTLKQCLKSHVLLTAWLEDELVGTLLLKVNKKHSYVSSVSVVAAHRGQGIASVLMKMVEDVCRGDMTKVKLHVRVDNPAQKLYFDLGYRVIRVVPKFYGNGATALLMEKPL